MKEKEIVDLYSKVGSLKKVYEETGYSFGKIRKILLTNGIQLDSDITREINELYNKGMSIDQIAARLKKSRNAIDSHLPYIKTGYNSDDKNINTNKA